MNIDELTIGQVKEIAAIFSPVKNNLDDFAIGQYVIIRTYAAGVWFGRLARKVGNEVILLDARRMWSWQCAKSISLSGIVRYGIDQSKSKIAPAIPSVWLEAIEILPIADSAMSSIKDAPDVEAE